MSRQGTQGTRPTPTSRAAVPMLLGSGVLPSAAGGVLPSSPGGKSTLPAQSREQGHTSGVTGLPPALQAGQPPRSCPGSPLGRQWPGQGSGSDCVSETGKPEGRQEQKGRVGQRKLGVAEVLLWGPGATPKRHPQGNTLVPQGGKQTPPSTTSWKPWAGSSAHPGWNPPSFSSAQGNSPGRSPGSRQLRCFGT